MNSALNNGFHLNLIIASWDSVKCPTPQQYDGIFRADAVSLLRRLTESLLHCANFRSSYYPVTLLQTTFCLIGNHSLSHILLVFHFDKVDLAEVLL